MSGNHIKKFKIEGMDCGGCAIKVDTAVRRIDGVNDASVSAASGTMVLTHDDTCDLSKVEKQVKGLGYDIMLFEASPQKRIPHSHNKSCGHDHDHSHEHKHDEKVEGFHGHDNEPTTGKWWESTKGKLTIACGFALLIAYGLAKIFPEFSNFLFIAAMFVGLFPIAKRALMAARAGTPFSIEMLMTIAAIGAIFINAAEEAAAVVLLFLIGELLEGVAAGKARESIQALNQLVPKTAMREENGQVNEVPAESLKINDTLLIRPGDRIAADGIILTGESAIDESSVTGESMPVRKTINAFVFAGTINADAVLRIKVTAEAKDNTIARVVKLVEEAQESKAPTERFIDSFAKYYTPFVVLIGALVACIPPLFLGGEWTAWIYKGLAVLLIGCPCALVISTPAAIAASLATGAKRGLLMKGGAVLETMGKITAICFDKTGTLTEGKPQVTDILAFNTSQSEVLKYAAALEVGSSHPLAFAILRKAEEEKLILPVQTKAEAHGGKGVSGNVEGKYIYLGSVKAANALSPLTNEQEVQITTFYDEGKSVSILLIDNNVAGAIAMRDEPRADAKRGLEALQAKGIKTIMLTGDNAITASAIGKQLNLEVRADLLPQDKLTIVKDLQSKGFKVAKIGDGINDAPALAAADIGIAMGGGTDVALETADAAILHGRVKDVSEMVDLSKRTMHNIVQNITIALGLKAVFLVTTILGLSGLWLAILADTGATVLVTANALRLLKFKNELIL